MKTPVSIVYSGEPFSKFPRSGYAPDQHGVTHAQKNLASNGKIKYDKG